MPGTMRRASSPLDYQTLNKTMLFVSTSLAAGLVGIISFTQADSAVSDPELAEVARTLAEEAPAEPDGTAP